MKATPLSVIIVGAMVFFGGCLVLGTPLPANQRTTPDRLFSATMGTSVWWVGAESTDSSALPNTGVRGTIQVISVSVADCLSFWVADGLSNGVWGQVGYFICSGSTPVAFYQVWGLANSTVLSGGSIDIGTGSHTFAMSLQSGTTWVYTVDGTDIGSFDMGAGSSSSSYPLEAMSEEQGSSVFSIPEVTFSPALQVLRSGVWSSVSVATSYGTSWGVEGNAQDSGLGADVIAVGGSLPGLPQGTTLWSSGSTTTTTTSTMPPPTTTVTVTSTVTSTTTSTVTSTTTSTVVSTSTSTATTTKTSTTTATSTSTATSTATVTYTSTLTTTSTASTTTTVTDTRTSTTTSTASTTATSTVTSTATQTTTKTTTSTATGTTTITVGGSPTTTVTVTTGGGTATSTSTVTSVETSPATTTVTVTLPATITVTRFTILTVQGPPSTSTVTDEKTTTKTVTSTVTTTLPASGTTSTVLSSGTSQQEDSGSSGSTDGPPVATVAVMVALAGVVVSGIALAALRALARSKGRDDRF